MKNTTSKATYTPGPWEVIQTGIADHDTLIIRKTTGAYVAELHASPLGHVGSMYENARLIATAPELLEYLKRAEAVLKMCGNDTREIRKVIAKAEGRDVTGRE